MDDSPGSRLWQRLFRVFRSDRSDFVEQAIREASKEGILDKVEGSMLLSILELEDLQVQDIMTPRMDIVCIEDTSPVSEAVDIIISSGHSRIPVFQEDRDNIIGIIHAKDLILAAMKTNHPTCLVSSLMRETFFVPETKKVLALLQEFRARKQHLAIILDEYGGTAGLISIEDVIEQIVGEIEDEHDTPRKEDVSLQDDGSYIISGRADLEDLVEELHIAVESEEVDTIGGYLSLIAGRVPKRGEEFDLDGAKFIVLDADAKQIHNIKVILSPSTLNQETQLVL